MPQSKGFSPGLEIKSSASLASAKASCSQTVIKALRSDFFMRSKKYFVSSTEEICLLSSSFRNSVRDKYAYSINNKNALRSLFSWQGEDVTLVTDEVETFAH